MREAVVVVAESQRSYQEVFPVGAEIEIDGNVVRVVARDGAYSAGRPSGYERLGKPALDIVGAFALLILASPFMLLAAIAVRLTMGSPVMLRQERVGLHGTVFNIYKFRTMEADRRRNDVVTYLGEDRRKTHKHPDDPRLTPVGRFLRKWSLDELPQLVNVLRGEMSLVGPRPELVEIVTRYEPWQHARHAVKPGLTGLWQISERGDKALHECTESDLAYIDGLSPGLDLKILLLTPLAALGLRRGF